MKSTLIITQAVAIAAACVLNLNAQNLVPNPSFEDTVPCAGWNINKLPCLPWKSAAGTPDYFNGVWGIASCNFTSSVPLNVFGYQFARTGFAYCGFGPYENSGLANQREYIQTQLSFPLTAGDYYYVSFYVSLSENMMFAVDRIGAYFSDSAIYHPSYNVFHKIPQVENDSGNVISDTAGWVKIDGYFYAVGGEQYITIGNFRTDSNTLIDSLPWGTEPVSYYFIDDVSVIDCTTTGVKENGALHFKLLQNLTKDYIGWVTNERITDVCIYDMNGKLILTQKYNQNITTYKLNVIDLKEGMYLLVIEDSNKKRGVRKFVKE